MNHCAGMKRSMHEVFFINPNIRNDEEKSADNTKKSSQENKYKESTQRSGLYEVQEWARKDGDLDSIYIRYLRSGDGNVECLHMERGNTGP